jgi:hypothetical protein
MASSAPLASGNQPALDFYSGLLSVVYGLLVSNGLQAVVMFGGDNPADQLQGVNGFQFIATFILTLHFWFAFATFGGTSDEFVEAISPEEAIFSPETSRNLLVIIDVLVATWLGFLLLEMFGTVSTEHFYSWLLLTSLTSLGYGGGFLMFIWGATWWRREQIEKSSIREQIRIIRERYLGKMYRWLRRDRVFVPASILMYVIDHYYPGNTHKSIAYLLAFSFIVVALLVLVMDAASVRPLRALRRWRHASPADR